MASKICPARGELRKWLGGKGRTQGKLAAAIGISQQRVSALVGAWNPSEDLAQLIEHATGIDWRGWFTDAELRKRDDAREKRIGRARALRSVAP